MITESFPPQQVIVKLLLALGVGLLIGLEREWANKDAGARSFAITALLGALSAMLSSQFAIASMIGVFSLVGFLNARRLLVDRTLEITTSIALIVTLILGILIGQDHYFTPVAGAILTTILLAWKLELSNFADRLRPEEIRSAVLLGLLSFVILPVLPRHSIDPFDLFNPREVWITIIVVGSIGFVNYVLLKVYGARGFSYSAVLGGLVNSTATIAELTETMRAASGDVTGILNAASLLTIFSMFVRNLLLLAILSPDSAPRAAIPLLAMAGTAFLLSRRKSPSPSSASPELKLASPVSLPRLGVFGMIFFAIQVAGTLAQRRLGGFGLLATSLVGGMFSSASTTAAAANLAARALTGADVAAKATILTSMVSAATNLPLIFRASQDVRSRLRLVATTGLVIAVGIAATLVQSLAAF